MTKTLQNFISRNIRGSFTKPSEDFFLNYAAIFPQEIVEIYRTLGFGFCENNLLQIVDSSSFFTILYEFGISILDSAVFAITALGDLLIYQKETFENQAPGLYLYSLRDLTCTRLCRPQMLSEWFGALDLSDVDNYNGVMGERKEALMHAIHTLALGSYVYGPRDFSAYALEPGMMLGAVAYDSEDCERLAPVDAIDYIQGFCESLTLRDEDNAIPFKHLTLDEKIASETAKTELLIAEYSTEPCTSGEAANDIAAPAATNEQNAAPSEQQSESAAHADDAIAPEAQEAVPKTHEEQPVADMPETPIIAPLYT
ncbi:MAG: hypothetical protein II767_10420, partial [Proteobacteria bacterium]|nr:hypothetical protein [Pseudomonadota bacterium]